LARHAKAEIKFLHVVEVSLNDSINTSGGPSNVSTLSDKVLVHEALKAAHEALGRSYVLHNLEHEENIKVTQTIRIGSPHSHVLACIEKEEIDLVVMGTKGAWGYSEVLVGSNTEKIVRKARCPVLAVKSAVAESAFDDIVFATEMSDAEQVVVDQVKEIQQLFNSRIHLVWINTRKNFRPDKLSKSLLREFAEDRGLTNYQIHVFNDMIPEDGIRHFADEINGGMIAMGTSSHTGLGRLLRGSVAEDTVNHAKRPVLTVSMKN
jgi:nucleotide-binding universal stress UspA family protein